MDVGMTSEYQRAHRAVVSVRGAASQHPCIGNCGGTATDWAYQHTDPDVKTDSRGLLYSTGVIYYAPMCHPCHAKFDAMHGTAEQKASRAEHMRWVQTQRFGYDSEAHAEAARVNAEKARAGIDRTDPLYLEKMKEAGRKAASVRRTCSCGKESTRAGIGTHQKKTGHEGYVDKERYRK